MTVQTPRRRPFALALAALTWLAFGLSAPILFNSFNSSMPIDDASVVAAGIDNHLFHAPIILEHRTGLAVRSGQLSFAARTGEQPTPEQVSAMLRAGSGKLSLTRSFMQIGTPASGEVRDSEATTPILRSLMALSFETLAIKESSIEVRLPSGQSERLSEVDVLVTPRRGSQIAAQGSALWRGQRVTIDATVAAAADSKDHYQLKLRLKSPLLDTTFDGRITRSDGLHLTGQSQSAVPDLRRLAREFGLGWQPGPGLRDVKVNGQLAWADKNMAFESVQVETDGHRATGAFSIRSGAKRPLLSGTLDFAALDIAKYFKIETSRPSAAPGAAAASPRSSWSADALWSRAENLLRLPLAQAIDVDLRVSANDVRYHTHRFGRSATSVALRNGKLQAQIAELEIGKGTGTGQLSANFNGGLPRFSLQARLDGIDIGSLAEILATRRFLQGTGTALFDLKAEGSTLAEVREALTGTAEISIGSDARLAIDLAQLWSAPTDMDKAAQSRLLRAAQRGVLALDQVEAECAIAGYSVHCNKIEATTLGRTLAATGFLNAIAGKFESTIEISKPVTPADSAVRPAATAPANTLPKAITPRPEPARTIILNNKGSDNEISVTIEPRADAERRTGQPTANSGVRRNGI